MTRDQGLAYYRGGDAGKPIVYEDFLPASATGIFRSNLDTDTKAIEHSEAGTDSEHDQEWMSGALGRDLYDPYVLYQKAAS